MSTGKKRPCSILRSIRTDHRTAARFTWRCRTGQVIIAAGGLLIVTAAPLEAHGFGQRYDLPLPLPLYLWSAGLAVALSFAIAAVFLRRTSANTARPSAILLSQKAVETGAWRIVQELVAIIGVAIFVLIIAAGLTGNQSPLRNIAPATVWIVWWVGMAFICALLGNIWPLLNPFDTLARWFGPARQSLENDRFPDSAKADALGAWPAVFLFAVFAWFELVASNSESPFDLALAALAYGVVTWAGMAIVGRRAWLASGEAFSVVFAIFGRFAPLSGPGLQIRPYAAGLVVARPLHPSRMVFVLLMLATVSYDGIMETPLWNNIEDSVFRMQGLAPVLFTLRDWTGDVPAVIRTLGLVVLPALFVLVYLTFIWAMRALTHGVAPVNDARAPVAAWRAYTVRELGGLFVLSLVPIAIAYHLAHYLSYLLIAGQMIIPLASDPFGAGWNLFGTARYRIDISVINARDVWYTAVVAIVIGHIIAVYLAHVIALKLYRDRWLSLISQIPIVILMIGYTMVSLWILAQPIVE